MATTKVVVNLPNEPGYAVRIGPGLIAGLGAQLRKTDASPRAAVVTDSNVGPLYLEAAEASLRAAGYATDVFSVAAGEAAKSLGNATRLWEALAAARFPRDGLVVALGGGVVGDLAGFVAATYMRGVALAQVPTSLLAMVDASVGGKTAVNLEAGKNLVGAFKQPIHVCASTDTLATLPAAQWACGLAEVAKTAAISSDEFFFWLSDSADELAAGDLDAASEAVTRCVVFKADTVAADPHEEKGIRECLNYGHTLGHAIEACAGFGRFSHGQAVAEGMRFAARLSVALLGTSADLVAAQDDLLDRLGLPALAWSAPPAELLDAMSKDKKVRGSALRFVLLSDIGNWEVRQVEKETVLEHLEAWARSKG